MKFLAILVLALATGSALKLPERQLKSRNIVVPAGLAEGRISHGSAAKSGQFPYMVGFVSETAKGGISSCGGSLISNTKVLTAAHCVDGLQNGTLYLGSTRYLFGEITYKITSKNIILHPNFRKLSLTNDIAIIDIPYTTYSENIQPIKIPAIASSYPTYIDAEVVAAGWGRVNDISPRSSAYLQFIYARVMSNEVCRVNYGLIVYETKLCTDTSGGGSTCQGDSGGPLVLVSTNTLIGITSSSVDYTCEEGNPAGFTRVSSYLDWIKDNAGVSY